ncbi:UvrD-helicase domain-containing protein [Patescibacteria group bacterium]|nr:UvrD-helicase domain-containing protein [Patescibacteria group bacterium]
MCGIQFSFNTVIISYMENGLNEKQQEATKHKNGPLLIVAGAGSGKTKTLVNRLIRLLKSDVSPEKIIAITFTNKAANEMRRRVFDSYESQTLENKLFVGTFHSFGAKILKTEITYFKREKNFTIFDDKDSLSLIKKILKNKNLSKEKFNPLVILKKISSIKSKLIDVDNLSPKDNYEIKSLEIYKEYENNLQKSNSFDFDDLITKVVKIFKEKSGVLNKYQDQYEYILIDEYQDINTAQYQLIKLLAGKYQNVFAIGDDAQSIYKFRGSDFRNFLNFEKDWPRAKIIKLEQNYRSTSVIVSASSNLIAYNKLQKPKKLWTNNKEGDLIKITTYQNSEEEARGICANIVKLIRNKEKIGEVAVLYRTNAQSRALEQTLIQNKIPYEIYGGLKFYARKEIKDLIAGLRYAFNPKDDASIERINKSFGKIKSKIIIQELPKLAKELTLVQIINYFFKKIDYTNYLTKSFKNPSERMENIKELINFASQHKDPYEFLEKVSLMSASDGKPKLLTKAVKLMTIHASKGLEFDNVFIVGCNEKLLPHEQSIFYPEEIEEERRLMYVAMTRAKKKLFISFYNIPSRFLGEIPKELIDFSKITSYGKIQSDWDDEYMYIE